MDSGSYAAMHVFYSCFPTEFKEHGGYLFFGSFGINGFGYIFKSRFPCFFLFVLRS